jgi:DNA-binding transcriptional ArsR family regulator
VNERPRDTSLLPNPSLRSLTASRSAGANTGPLTEMGPAWVRWVHAAIPDDTVSYARLRMLSVLDCHPGGLTMTKLAEALEVTGRRVTALVDALADDHLVERYAHPTDGRSTLVEITEAGRGAATPGVGLDVCGCESPSRKLIVPDAFGGPKSRYVTFFGLISIIFPIESHRQVRHYWLRTGHEADRPPSTY